MTWLEIICACSTGIPTAGLGEEVELKPDLDQVPALSAEREAQWRRVAEAAFLTDPEKRRMLGLPALPQEEDAGE